jgi:hypothetical protein
VAPIEDLRFSGIMISSSISYVKYLNQKSMNNSWKSLARGVMESRSQPILALWGREKALSDCHV